MLTRRDLGKFAATGAVSLAVPLRHALAASRPTLTIAVDNLWPTMLPLTGISTTTLRVFPNFYEKLIERDYVSDPQGLKLAPKLAEKWEQNGNIWNITLRQGVKFHNGQEMTADDVAFTLSADRLWGPKPIEPRGKAFTDGFTRVQATGKYTVEIETVRPDLNMPGKLTGYIGMVVPKKYYLDVGPDKFGLMPIGAGPYKVTSFNSSESMVMQAFEDYYGAPPPAQKLVWQIVPEFSARLAGLVSGEFDFIVNIPTDQEKVIQGYSNVKLVRKQADNYASVAFNCLPDPADNPLVDVNLRYAMCQGVNMDEIVKALFGDATYSPPVPFDYPEYGRFYDPSRKPPLPFDPQKAKDLVKKTKYKGEKLGWHITKQFYPNYEDAAQIMIQQWADIGINVEAQVLDNFDLVYRRPFHLMSFSNATNFIPGDPYQPLANDWGAAAPRATAPWKTWTPPQAYNDAVDAFIKTTDFDSRYKAYLAMSNEWQNVTPALVMWKSLYNWAHRSGITWVPVADSDMRMYGGYLTLG